MSVGVMKDYKLKQRNLFASHTLVDLGTGTPKTVFAPGSPMMRTFDKKNLDKRSPPFPHTPQRECGTVKTWVYVKHGDQATPLPGTSVHGPAIFVARADALTGLKNKRHWV
jgi:hypothetical protein